jgi:hypothetical protein
LTTNKTLLINTLNTTGITLIKIIKTKIVTIILLKTNENKMEDLVKI